MNTLQIISENSSESFVPDKLFFESPLHASYLWKNLITEKRNSIGWVNKLYKGSVLHAFLSVLSSPIS